MTKEQMQQMVDSFQLRSYHVTIEDDENVILRFGDDDPMEVIRKKDMEIEVMKTQLSYLMSLTHDMPYGKTEGLIR